ncbi:MAG: ATP-binding cassette domain-containing protein [Bacteroidales bacterium]|nr:ATP-binding cassette domain-containing protein [Bacteroidales bacterium]
MSKEILEALMQLFALIAKQGSGVQESEINYVHNFLRQQLSSEAVDEYMELFRSKAGLNKPERASRKGSVSVIDSVRIFGPAKKINRRLDQKQKVVVLVRLFELLKVNLIETEQQSSKDIIDTIADVFKIDKVEYESIEIFVMRQRPEELDISSILIAADEDYKCVECKSILTEGLHGRLYIFRVKSEELYFVRYTGSQNVLLNGLPINNQRIYLFANGGTIKLPKGKPIYYSDVVSKFMEDITSISLSFVVSDVEYRFPSGGIGLRNISFSEIHGNLIGIMGASGAGKTTLLNVLAGMYTPTSGSVRINGINVHQESDKLEGVLGYIPQDDLLIEELTVYQNLYYNAKLCFSDKNEEEIASAVEKTLRQLGLWERKHLKVGTPLNKMISGGQRKRLNIALELIREPSILYVDEPTSGLSSRDAENVMELLSELTLKGKLIFVVIHQPSADIYKMFDRMIFLDTGGYLVYYGNPVAAITYFKKMDAQVNSDQGECPTCGNVTPELIFDIMEARVVDEYGQYTEHRKIKPQVWEEYFLENLVLDEIEEINDDPPKSSIIPSWFNQLKIFSTRDVVSKISNTQYVVLTLLEAPILGFVLAFLIRYIADPKSSIYIFRENENVPAYIFMSIVVALFLGLIVSAEEIFRDRKILKREEFLNLSRSGYLISKVLILASISAVQAFLYVLVGNLILGITEMFFHYWFALFATFVFANMLGLNISATFNSAVTIYVIIPLIMIPMMALGGAFFSFDKLNRTIGAVDKVPLVAEFMPSRWAYEALLVHQFKNNKYEKRYYTYDKALSFADFRTSYYLPELDRVLDETSVLFSDDSIDEQYIENISLIHNTFVKESKLVKGIPVGLIKSINVDEFDEDVAEEIRHFIKELTIYYGKIIFRADSLKQAYINHLEDSLPGYDNRLKKRYHNERIADIVQKLTETHKILRYKDKLVQHYKPIFLEPENRGVFAFRTHFFAPHKLFFNKKFETYWFNVSIIWLIVLLLYPPLYYEHFRRGMDLLNDLDFNQLREKFKRKEKKVDE